MQRVAHEKALIEALAGEDWWTFGRWLMDGYRLAVEGIIHTRGATFPVRLVFPDQYPLVPCWVEPQDRVSRWSAHQYGDGGSLCLELRPDNWTSTASGADMLRSAHHLLEAEVKGDGATLSSAHHMGEVQAFNAGRMPVLVGAGCAERIRHGIAIGLRAHRWPMRADFIPVYLSDDVDAAAGRVRPDDAASAIPAPVIDLDAAQADAAENWSDMAQFTDASPMLVSLEGRLAIARTSGHLQVFHQYRGNDTLYRRELITLNDDAGKRSGRADGAALKRVALIGAGSVGSKVAESLVRSGVRDMVIFDGDVMLPANLERHALDWRDVGYRKVDALQRRLLAIATDLRIITRAVNLRWQLSAKNHASNVGLLTGADIIVDATGDMPTSLYLGALATVSERPFVSVQVFEGGLGSLVARSLPGRDPPYIDGHARYRAWCNAEATAPPPSGRRAYEAFDSVGEPVVADDAAVTMAAGTCARVALDVLDGAVDSQQPAWLLSGFKRGWIFEGLGSCVRLDVGILASAESDGCVDEAGGEVAKFVLSLVPVEDDATAAG
ncbi:MAG: ThiF family adenylyltransferase [Rhodanobacter sp.]